MAYSPASIVSALEQNESKLKEVLSAVAGKCMHDAFLLNANKADEVWMLYYFFLEGLPRLETGLNAVLNPAGVRVVVSGIANHGTAFVQQDPVARGRSCELGDIVFIVTYGGLIAGNGLGNALLVQAKLERDQINDPEQVALYGRAQSFRYRDDAFKKAMRVLPAKNEPALAYWSFEAVSYRRLRPSPYRRPDEQRFIQPQALDETSSDLNFGEALYELMRGRWGKDFTVPSASDQGWSSIIFDLLRVVSLQAIRNKVVKRHSLSGQKGITPADLAVLVGHDLSFAKTSLSEILQRFQDPDLQRVAQRLEGDQNTLSADEAAALLAGEGPPRPPPEGRSLFGEKSGAGGCYVIFDLIPDDSVSPRPFTI